MPRISIARCPDRFPASFPNVRHTHTHSRTLPTESVRLFVYTRSLPGFRRFASPFGRSSFTRTSFSFSVESSSARAPSENRRNCAHVCKSGIGWLAATGHIVSIFNSFRYGRKSSPQPGTSHYVAIAHVHETGTHNALWAIFHSGRLTKPIIQYGKIAWIASVLNRRFRNLNRNRHADVDSYAVKVRAYTRLNRSRRIVIL